MSQISVKLPTVRFSPDDDELLIEFVQTHATLYDLKDSEYKNTLKKDLLWNGPGKVIKKEGKECKKRWKSMRDHYKRKKREEKSTTGKAAKKKRAVYWERLQFLDTVEDERSSFTNVLTTSNDETSTPSDQTDIQELEYEDGPSEQPSQQLYRQQSSQTQTAVSTSSTDGQAPVFQTRTSKTRKERVATGKYMQERQEDRLHLKQCLEDLAREPIPQENEIDLFFRTMAATVKKFRPDLATKTKASVFKVVTDMELLKPFHKPTKMRMPNRTVFILPYLPIHV